MAEAQYFKRLNFQKEQKLLEAVSLFNSWLDELLIAGISQLQHDPVKLNEIASRMVDYGAPGIARKLRMIPERIAKGSNWMEFTFQQLGEFYFVINSFKNIVALNDFEKEDLLSYCGIPFTKTSFSESSFYTDDWLYLGTVSENEDKLIVNRNWFYGLNCKSCVLFLEFQFNRFVPIKQFKYGFIYKSAVQFYPSASPQRIKEIQSESSYLAAEYSIKSQTIETALDLYCERISINPLLKQDCFILNSVNFTLHQETWYLKSESGQLIRLANSITEIQELLTYTANVRNFIIGEYENNSLKVFSVIMDYEIINLKQ